MRNKWNHTTHSTNIDKHPQALLENRKQTKGGTFRTKCVARRWLSGQRYLGCKHDNQNLITGTNIKVLEKTDHTTLSSDLHVHTLACAPTTLHISYTHRYKHAQLLKIEQKCLGVLCTVFFCSSQDSRLLLI